MILSEIVSKCELINSKMHNKKVKDNKDDLQILSYHPVSLFSCSVTKYHCSCRSAKYRAPYLQNGVKTRVLVLVYTQEGSLWSIVLRGDDHTGIFTCDGCARDPYFYVPAETQSYVIKLSCSRKVLAASGD